MPNRKKAKRRPKSRPLEKAQATSVGYRDNELYYAIKEHNVQEILQILKNASAVSLSQDGLDKALLAVCRKGHKFLVQSLVRSGASVNTMNAFGSTPLLICAEKGFTDIVRFLVKNGAKINTANAAGDTALILSIRPAGSVNMTQFLLEQKDINVHHQNCQGDTALKKAVEAMDVDTIKLLIDKQNVREVRHNMVIIFSAFGLPSRQNTTPLQTFVKQTADRVGLRRVLTLLHESRGKNDMPVIKAALAHDVDSFNILIDSQFSEVTRVFEELLKEWLNISETNPDIAIIKTLLAKGADVNGSPKLVNESQDPKLDVDPPIITATKIGSNELVQLLCEYGADPCETDRTHTDPVMTAAENGMPSLIDLLISFGGRVNKPNRYYGYQDSALDLTLRKGHTNCAELLLKYDAKMNVSSALSSAVEHKAFVYLKFLFDNYGVAVQELLRDTKNSLRNRLLFTAVRGGDADFVKALLDFKCNISRSSAEKKNPLIETEGAEMVQRGADVNQNSYGQLIITSADECAETGHDIDLNTQEEDGSTLMMEAVKSSNTEMVNLLIERGANVNLEDGNGDTALLIATNYPGNTDLLSTLIKSGADINYHNKAGYTALMKASQNADKDALQLLISAGADINLVNQTGNATALSVLFNRFRPSYDFYSCAEYLLDQGSLASFITSDALLQVIHDGHIMLVPKLISGGLGPGDGKSTLIQRLLLGPAVSPLCVALIEGNIDLARYLYENWFLTKFDVASLPRNEGLREILNVRGHNECLAFLDDITTQPASLLKLSFVTVSSAIGCVPGREEKVNSLPLPPIMKEKLLFKREDVTLHIPESHVCVPRSFTFRPTLQFCVQYLMRSDFNPLLPWFG